MSGPALADWRLFATGRFRWYHLLALSAGIVGVLTGFDVVIPFALAIGCPPAVTPLLGMLALAGGVAPLVLPALLERSGGNLRGLTILISTVGETRGLWLALLVLLLAGGLLAPLPAMLLLIVLIAVSGVLGPMVGTSLLTWHSAVFDEDDRRLVVPRLMSVSLAVGAMLLLPTALLMDGLVRQFGLVVYAVPFGLAGLFGVFELLVQARLPRPGRVRVPASALSAPVPPPPAMAQFLRSSMLNSLGMGVAPYLSVYALVVLGLTPGFTMAMGAVSLLTQVAASAWAGSRLTRGSSSRMLRFSFGIRAWAMAAPLLALPGLFLAPVLLMLSAVLGAIGFVSGTLAGNERLFRLINGPAVLRQYGRYTAANAGAMTIGQLASGFALAAGGELGYLLYGGLFAASTGLRVVAYRVAAPRAEPAVVQETAEPAPPELVVVPAATAADSPA
jgi:hypothetical protein